MLSSHADVRLVILYDIFVFPDLRLAPSTTRGYQPLPGQLYGFPNCISLPLKQVVMNPFPTKHDYVDSAYATHKPVLLMLRTSQKYFIQERSLVAPEVIF